MINPGKYSFPIRAAACLLASLSARAAGAAEGAAQPDAPRVGNQTATDGAQDRKTRVFACSVYFPLDSVQFMEGRIEECLKGIDMQRVTYIHVIATASMEGTNEHNFYLSNRRAGAIEGYIKNRYPEVQVHAFGGGENPKFGKSARILIVESADSEDPKANELTEAIMQEPEVRIEYRTEVKTEVKTVTKTEFREPEKMGLFASIRAGRSYFKPTEADYQVVGFGIEKALAAIDLGLAYEIHRSNRGGDVHAGMVTAGRVFEVLRYGGGARGLGLGVKALMGAEREDGTEFDVGASGSLRYFYKDFAVSLNLGASRNFRTFATLECGVHL